MGQHAREQVDAEQPPGHSQKADSADHQCAAIRYTGENAPQV
jgi:hypothetical protein